MKNIKKLICSTLAIILIMSTAITVLACQEQAGRTYFSCGGGHACYKVVCFTHTMEYSTVHSNGCGCVYGHVQTKCNSCGIKTCCEEQSHIHGFPCNPCYHSCQTHHTNHCLTCHSSPCICYPAASSITIPTGYFKQLSVNIASSVGATGHKIYDSSKSLLQAINGASCTFDIVSNGTWYVRPFNVRGENPTFQEIKITSIDHELPTVSPIEGNPTDWTKDDVTITVPAQDAHSGLHPQAYSFDGGVTWQASNEFTYAYNAVVDNIMVRDALENYISVPSFEITKIDKTHPTATASGNPTVWQRGDVIILVVAQDNESGLASKPFSFDGGATWVSKNSHVYTQNATLNNIQVKDYVGNIFTISSFGISKIDKTEPTAEISGNPVQWQSGNVVIDVIANDSGSGLATKPYSFDDGITWQTGNTHTYTANGDIHNIKVCDAVGNIYAVPKFSIKKIDKTKPTATISGVPTDWTRDDVTITISAADAHSGLHPQAYSFDGGATWQSNNIFVYARNGIFDNVIVRDALENIVSVPSFEINKIDKTTPLFDTATIPPSVATNGDSLFSYNIEDNDSGLTDTFELTTWAIRDKSTTKNTVVIPYSTSKTRALINYKKTAIFELGVTNNPHIVPGDIIAGEITVTDLADNKSSYIISEMMLDNIEPTVTDVKVSTTWSSSSNKAVISAQDNETQVVEWGISTSKEKENIMWSTSNEFDVKENNTYYAFAKDLNGNISNAFAFKVSNVDKSAPTVNEVAHSHIYTKEKYALTVNATDIGGGIVSYGISTANLPIEWSSDNQFTIAENGTYNLFAQDRANNISAAVTVVVRYIDTVAPDLSYTVPSTWTNRNVSISFKTGDSLSGVKYITLPDGTVSQSAAFSHEFSQNGTYSFTVTDKADNSSTHNVVIKSIDKLKPKITYEVIEDEADKTAVILLAATDTISGVANIVMPDKSTIIVDKTELRVYENGTYIFSVKDNAGNFTTQEIKLDLQLLKKQPEKKAKAYAPGLIGLSVAGAVTVAGAGTAALSAATFNNILGGGTGGVFISYLFAGADAIAIDHKKSKKRRIKICDGIIDLTMLAEQAQTIHFTIVLNKKYIKKNLGQIIKVVIEGDCVSTCVVKEDTFKIVI